MIYCLTKKPNEYLAANGTGLYHSYGHDPHLFSLLSRTSAAFFQYEPGFEGLVDLKKIVRLSDINLWLRTLDCEVLGVKVRTAVETMSPRQFTDLLYQANDELLPLHELYQGQIDPELMRSSLWFNSYMRTLQHEKFYRGKIGPGLTVAFRSRLNSEEDKWLETQKAGLLEAMKEVVNGR